MLYTVTSLYNALIGMQFSCYNDFSQFKSNNTEPPIRQLNGLQSLCGRRQVNAFGMKKSSDATVVKLCRFNYHITRAACSTAATACFTTRAAAATSTITCTCAASSAMAPLKPVVLLTSLQCVRTFCYVDDTCPCRPETSQHRWRNGGDFSLSNRYRGR